MTEQNQSSARDANRRLIRRLALVSVGMFGFGFALWPLYNIFCDITGVGGRGVKVEQGHRPTGEVSDREVTLRFDATVNSALPWEFRPAQSTQRVRLGEMSEAAYLAFNTEEQDIIGHAIYNVTPAEASLYFVKTECFCFTEQLLAGGETREMPVLFYVSPDLPDHISEITLSYTFFQDKAGGQPLADSNRR